MMNFVTLLCQLACAMSDVFRGLAFVHKHGVPGLRSVGHDLGDPFIGVNHSYVDVAASANGNGQCLAEKVTPNNHIYSGYII